MKVLIINGSPRKDGNTSTAVNELVKTFQAEEIETEVCRAGNKDIRGCFACGECSATFDELNKFFTISGMPVASSQYWNSVHGREKGEAEQDAEGLQTMRTLARNMSFLMKAIALGKEKYGLPEKEAWQPTHFIK